MNSGKRGIVSLFGALNILKLKEVTLEMYERFLVDFALIRYFLWEGVFVMKGDSPSSMGAPRFWSCVAITFYFAYGYGNSQKEVCRFTSWFMNCFEDFLGGLSFFVRWHRPSNHDLHSSSRYLQSATKVWASSGAYCRHLLPYMPSRLSSP